jgi:hypothetical protein
MGCSLTALTWRVWAWAVQLLAWASWRCVVRSQTPGDNVRNPFFIYFSLMQQQNSVFVNDILDSSNYHQDVVW